MRPEKKKRIDTEGSQAPLGGLGSAFEKISLPDLPAASPGSPGAPSSSSSSSPPSSPPERVWKMGRVLLRKETARRGGKTVIVVHDFATHLPVSVIETVAKKIRAGCGCGGTVKERTIEIQGDQPGKIRELLEGEGFQVGGVK